MWYIKGWQRHTQNTDHTSITEWVWQRICLSWNQISNKLNTKVLNHKKLCIIQIETVTGFELLAACMRNGVRTYPKSLFCHLLELCSIDVLCLEEISIAIEIKSSHPFQNIVHWPFLNRLKQIEVKTGVNQGLNTDLHANAIITR